MTFRLAHLQAAIVLAAVLAARSAFATALPDSYPLNDAEEDAEATVDANLEEWLGQHVEQPSPLDLDAEKFEEYAAKQDQVVATYLRLARLNMQPNATAAQAKPFVEAASKLINGDRDSSQPTVLNHPLLPFLYLEMLKAGALPTEERAKTLADFNQLSAGTCAAKQYLYEQLTRENLTPLSDDQLKDMMTRIEAFRSVSYKKLALRRLFGSVPDAKQRVIADRALGLAALYPSLIRQTPWLAKLQEKHGKGGESESPITVYDEARQLAGHRQCSKAKQLLVEVIGGKAKGTVEEAVSTAKAIDGCYRGRDTQLRLEFWQNITAKMSDAFGFDGWAESRLRLGFIEWSHNNFDAAKPVFQEVISKADNAPKYKKYQARAVFALGRIAENENEPERAAEHYKEYLSRFADQENFEEALMAVVLLHAQKAEWDQALAPLEALIQAQSLISPDERSTSTLSFGLFWAGRVYLEQGRIKEATEMWRRVASEYYSTYYGAIGHYMLEKTTGHRLALQPARTPPFRMHVLREAFSPADQTKLKRVEMLMRLGLRGEGICEMEELDMADGKAEKQLVRALMLHASGNWLEAVKAYDALPRTYRNTLPTGFERILFPRRYGEQIRALAKKADVDPDLVMAVIRQESVFNPLARSQVGAMGLMQLMPATAMMEVKKLESTYISAEDRRNMRQRIGSPLGLLVADTNLAIGIHHLRSLLEKYQSPVYVLSAYNASPAAAQHWMTTIPTKDVLAFIEKIPYKETRAYVKLVLRNYFYYKRWYGDPKDTLKHLDAVTSPLVALTQPEKAPAITPAVAPAKTAPNH